MASGSKCTAKPQRYTWHRRLGSKEVGEKLIKEKSRKTGIDSGASKPQTSGKYIKKYLLLTLFCLLSIHYSYCWRHATELGVLH